MGYSKNRNSLLRVEPLLILLTKTENTVLIPSKSPRETLYSLREGLKYAEEHNVEPYNKLKEKFILKEKRDGIEVKLRRQIHFESPITQLANSQNLVVESAVTVLDVIGAVIFHKSPRMEFPKSNVVGNALITLEKWANANQYKIVQSNPFVIMEREVINAVQESGTE